MKKVMKWAPSSQKQCLTPRFNIVAQVHLHGYDEHVHYTCKMTKSKKSLKSSKNQFRPYVKIKSQPNCHNMFYKKYQICYPIGHSKYSKNAVMSFKIYLRNFALRALPGPLSASFCLHFVSNLVPTMAPKTTKNQSKIASKTYMALKMWISKK